MSAVKVKTYPIIPPSWTTTTLEAFYPKRSLPFTKSSRSGRMHRVRWVIAFQPLMRGGAELLPARLVPCTWCGTSMVRGHLYADSGDWEICGTCEGRAIGAGQIPTPPERPLRLVGQPPLHDGLLPSAPALRHPRPVRRHPRRRHRARLHGTLTHRRPQRLDHQRGQPMTLIPEPVDTSWPWQQHAACRGQNPNDWHPERGVTDLSGLKAICATCPVQAECLTYALVANEQYGIWGGTSANQRKAMRRSWVAPCARCGERALASPQATYCPPCKRLVDRESASARHTLAYTPTPTWYESTWPHPQAAS